MMTVLSIQRLVKGISVLSFIAALTACGGGGGGKKGNPQSSAAQVVASSSKVAVTSSSSSIVSNISILPSSSASSSSKSSRSPSYLMGGAVQGNTLNLAAVTSTLAGASSDADGVGKAARFSSPNAVVRVSSNLYVVDYYNRTIRKVAIETGAVSTFAGAAGTEGSADGVGVSASFVAPYGITSDGNNLYVTDNNTIRKITLDTREVSTLAGMAGVRGNADGIGVLASFRDPHGIATDGVNLYVADADNRIIRKVAIDTGMVTTIAGTALVKGNVDGTGSDAKFNAPYGVAIIGNNLYVTDVTSQTIRKINISTRLVTTLAGAVGVSGSKDGVGDAATFNRPESITVDDANLYVTESENHIIRKIVVATGEVETLVGAAGVNGNADGTGASAKFDYPYGISSDGTNLYVADFNNNSIRKVVIATGVVTTLAGSSVDRAVDGLGGEASFQYPMGITFNGENLYVADTYNSAIRKVIIGTGEVSTLEVNGFTKPRGITSNGSYLFLTNTGRHKIEKIDLADGAITTIAGTSEGWGSSDGVGSDAHFNDPSGITTDGTNLYVSDTFNHTIRKINIATRQVTTLAGTAGSSNSTDGIAANAKFREPRGITTDGTNLYVADSGNDLIRKIVIATGEVTTLRINIFSIPIDVTTDGYNLYVTDMFAIRKIVLATGEVTMLAGRSEFFGSSDGVGANSRFSSPTGITTDGFSLFVADTNNNTIRKIQ